MANKSLLLIFNYLYLKHRTKYYISSTVAAAIARKDDTYQENTIFNDFFLLICIAKLAYSKRMETQVSGKSPSVMVTPNSNFEFNGFLLIFFTCIFRSRYGNSNRVRRHQIFSCYIFQVIYSFRIFQIKNMKSHY